MNGDRPIRAWRSGVISAYPFGDRRHWHTQPPRPEHTLRQLAGAGETVIDLIDVSLCLSALWLAGHARGGGGHHADIKPPGAVRTNICLRTACVRLSVTDPRP
eukprot:5298485-Prymnesium_polylepis.1